MARVRAVKGRARACRWARRSQAAGFALASGRRSLARSLAMLLERMRFAGVSTPPEPQRGWQPAGRIDIYIAPPPQEVWGAWHLCLATRRCGERTRSTPFPCLEPSPLLLLRRQHAQTTWSVREASERGGWCRACCAPGVCFLPLLSPRSVTFRFAAAAFRSESACPRLLNADAAAALIRCPG